MNELVIEWTEKAEGDLATAGREIRARKSPNYDASCFHSQQAVEKYLKAYLLKNQVYFPKTHNLIALLELCLPLEPSLDLQRDQLELLNLYAVRFRYPGDSADKSEAKRAYKAAADMCNLIKNLLST